MTLYRLGVIRDTGKRAYVEYYVWNPHLKDLERKRSYCGRVRDSNDRRDRLFEIKKEIDNRLLSGWTFYQEDTSQKPAREKTILQILDDVLAYKKLTLEHRAYVRQRSFNNRIQTWLRSQHLHELFPSQIKRHHVEAFLISVLQKGCSTGYRNKYLSEISTMFNDMNRIGQGTLVPENPCKGIYVMDSDVETHLAYTNEQAKQISRWLKENQHYTWFYCGFIVYCFLRPSEINRLQVQHIDVANMEIRLWARNAKTKKPRLKLIQKPFQAAIRKMKLKDYPPDYFVFSAAGHPFHFGDLYLPVFDEEAVEPVC